MHKSSTFSETRQIKLSRRIGVGIITVNKRIGTLQIAKISEALAAFILRGDAVDIITVSLHPFLGHGVQDATVPWPRLICLPRSLHADVVQVGSVGTIQKTSQSLVLDYRQSHSLCQRNGQTKGHLLVPH